MIQPGLNLFEMLPRKLHAALLVVGGFVCLDIAWVYFLLRDKGGIFGIINYDTWSSLLSFMPRWLIEWHKSTFALWFHIIILTVLGLAVIWEGIKYWKTGR